MPALDSQQVEIVGRNLLITHLLAGGVEVARPERDKGIDLIAYLDRSPAEFVARPVQLKVSRKRAFGIDKKYAKTPGLLMVYVWNADDPEDAEIYALRYSAALRIADQLGWTSSPSWTDKGRYVTTAAPKQVCEALAGHRMDPGDWIGLIER